MQDYGRRRRSASLGIRKLQDSKFDVKIHGRYNHGKANSTHCAHTRAIPIIAMNANRSCCWMKNSTRNWTIKSGGLAGNIFQFSPRVKKWQGRFGRRDKSTRRVNIPTCHDRYAPRHAPQWWWRFAVQPAIFIGGYIRVEYNARHPNHMILFR